MKRYHNRYHNNLQIAIIKMLFLESLWKNDHTLTLCTSIELHSHGDMPVPSPWVNTDGIRLDPWIETVLDYTVLISVSCEILEK